MQGRRQKGTVNTPGCGARGDGGPPLTRTRRDTRRARVRASRVANEALQW